MEIENSSQGVAFILWKDFRSKKTLDSSRTLIYKLIVKLYALFKTQDCQRKPYPVQRYKPTYRAK